MLDCVVYSTIELSSIKQSIRTGINIGSVNWYKYWVGQKSDYLILEFVRGRASISFFSIEIASLTNAY